MRPSLEQLQLEVRELTDQLRNCDGLADLRAVLAAKGLSAPETILAGLIEGEDESQYGVILTANQELILFEIAPDGGLTRWEMIEHPDTLTHGFQAVSVAIAMKRDGEISYRQSQK